MDDSELWLLCNQGCHTLTMHIENEIKILNIDPIAVEKKLKSLGFKPSGQLNFRRYVYDVAPVNPNAWIRLRTDGKQTTLTFKESLKDTVNGMKEIEIIVDDFDETNELLKAIGHQPRNYQENSRINYEGMNCMVSIDSWPQIPPYMEIEANDADDVKKCMETLSAIITPETTSLSTEEVYRQYGIDLAAIKELRFKKPLLTANRLF